MNTGPSYPLTVNAKPAILNSGYRTYSVDTPELYARDALNIYTDGSVAKLENADHSVGSVGCYLNMQQPPLANYVHPELDQSDQAVIGITNDINMMELRAVMDALKHFILHRHHQCYANVRRLNLMIDSMNVIEWILNIQYPNEAYLYRRIHRLYFTIRRELPSDFEIQIYKVRSHVDAGNVTADRLANEARLSIPNPLIYLPCSTQTIRNYTKKQLSDRQPTQPQTTHVLSHGNDTLIMQHRSLFIEEQQVISLKVLNAINRLRVNHQYTNYSQHIYRHRTEFAAQIETHGNIIRPIDCHWNCCGTFNHGLCVQCDEMNSTFHTYRDCAKYTTERHLYRTHIEGICRRHGLASDQLRQLIFCKEKLHSYERQKLYMAIAHYSWSWQERIT